MSRMNCMVIDDEPLARKGIKEYAARLPFLDCVAELEDAAHASSLLKRIPVDLLFLDINMPLMSGIEFIRNLEEKPIVVITTAYPDFALQGYELEVLDYLVKPVSFERFARAASRAHNLYSMKNRPLKEDRGMPYFFIKCEGKYEKIGRQDILYVLAMQNYVALHTSTRRYITHLPIKSLEEQLGGNDFVRIHKSYLVNVNRIDSIAGNEISLGGEKLTVSRNYREEAFRRILENNLIAR